MIVIFHSRGLYVKIVKLLGLKQTGRMPNCFDKYSRSVRYVRCIITWDWWDDAFTS